ncbi:EF-hand calcium-binding domain-containing protein 6 [Alligator sinensis]|uniref:EF-hand calcium-binding domain-containing protein 6 n=1 Tax=Alligator sinensis TaxID=38654 RepID=A0A1U8DPC0_ALLSI|nr:EF-hand calcium-binding domain-containing protein 6 [Alligator sinensis]
MSMSQLYANHSLLHDDHGWQEEPLITIHLVPLCPSIPRTSTDDEAEEVESQEEAHAADTSSTATETQEHAEPDKITENWKDFHKALQFHDPKNADIISRNHLRKMLWAYCPSLSDEQFAKMKQIEDQTNKHTKNRTVNEVIERLKDNVIQQEASIKDSFLAFNKQSSGKISKVDFRKMLEDHGMPMDANQFNLLIEKLGFPDRGLSYLDFVASFEGRPKQTRMDAELACDQAHYYLVIKAQTRWHDLARNFREFDREGNGIVQPKDLRNVLYRFAIPITSTEFEKLWARYDTDLKGYLTCQEFLQKMGAEIIPADIGLSSQIAEDDCETLKARFSNQQKKHSKLEEQQKQQTQALPISEIKKQIKWDKFRDYFQNFNKAFYKMDKNRDSYITIDGLCRILQELNYSLNEDYLGISIHDSKLSYVDFLRAFDDSRASKYQQRQKQAAPPAFSLFAMDGTGLVKVLEFHQVLDHFCFKLSNKQFRHLFKKLKLCEPHTVDWKIFLHNIRLLSDVSKKDILIQVHEVVTACFNTISQEFKDIDCAKENTVSKEDFRRVCNQHFMLLTDEQFENLWNTVPVNADGKLKYCDFLKTFNAEALTMPSDTPVANNPASASNCSTPAEPGSQLSSQPSCPKTASSAFGRSKTPISSRPHTAVAWSPPLLNCEPIENKIRKNIQHSWREILKECKEKDVSQLGEIPGSDFSAIVEKFNLDLSKEEFSQITTKYDIKNNGKCAYYDFLQCCVLSLKPQGSSVLQRMVVQKLREPRSPGPQSLTFFKAMLKIQPQILYCWRPMRRSFKSYDKSRTGLLNIQDFKQVLREYSVNLSEEEFFHILEFYDKALTSKVSYNDFLRAFLQ